MGNFLIHRPGDSVGVATEDLERGGRATGRFRDARDGDGTTEVEMVDPVPLGHKLAVIALAEGDTVMEYGVAIGVATADVRIGEHVHTHNLKGQRWA